jgi:ABC-type multidrug transport system fused ATPase/permease subunit
MRNFLFTFDILSKKELINFYLLVFLFFISTILEIFGISIFLPLLKSIIDPNFSTNNNFINNFNLFKVESDSSLIINYCLIIVLLFILKIFFSLISIIYFNNFIALKQKKISYFLIENYLNQKFIFFLNNNSSKLIQNSINETSQITYTYLSSVIILIPEIFFLTGIIIFLTILNPLESLIIISSLLIFLLIFYNMFKKRYLDYGIIRNENDTKRYQVLEETFGSIKDIILKNKKNFFLKRFKKHNDASVFSSKKVMIFQSFPRFIFELLVIISFVLITIYLTYNNQIISILPTLGLFAAISFRAIPSINKIFSCLNNIKYASRSIDIVIKEIKSYQNKKIINQNIQKELIIFDNEITLKNIEFKFPNTDNNIFEKIDFSIKKNSFIGIMAESGVGKSTLVNIICGLLTPSNGNIFSDNKLVNTESNEWKKKFGIVPQNFFMLDDTIENNITFGDDIKKNQLLFEKAIDQSESREFIESRENKFSEIIGQKGTRISGGQQQRLAIARALYFNPEILIFDEATNSLDKKTENSILNTIKKMASTKTIIQISHDPDALKYCEEIFKLSKRKLEKI